VDGKRHPRSGLLPPGKRRTLILPKVRSGRVRKISPSRGFDTLAFQPPVTWNVQDNLVIAIVK
jgi:hypothetical protein